MIEPFDFDKALKAVQSGQAISGKGGVLTPGSQKISGCNYPLTGRFSITRGKMGTFSDDIRQRWDRLQSCAEPVQ